jgi:broad specificity phosphatase PhoE
MAKLPSAPTTTTQLSDLGHKQSVRLGEYFAYKGIHFDGLIAGTLRRHKQTLEGILQGMNRAASTWPGKG